MPKRKSSSHTEEYIKKKIKKLEKKLLKQTRQASSDSDNSLPVVTQPEGNTTSNCDPIGNLAWPDSYQEPVYTDHAGPSPQDHDLDLLMLLEPPALPEPQAPYHQRAPTAGPSRASFAEVRGPTEAHIALPVESLSAPYDSALQLNNLQPPEGIVSDLTAHQDAGTETDEITLQILGQDPSQINSVGKDFQKDLALRCEHIATSGLSKELRKELLEKYLPPGNCQLVDAPSINPEVKVAVLDSILKRDKAIQAKQKQIASAISCLGDTITTLLGKVPKDVPLLKKLVDAVRLLCDSQYNESVTRRNFIMAALKKDLRDQLQQTKIDKLLFGNNFADTLRNVKAINKSGADLKHIL